MFLDVFRNPEELNCDQGVGCMCLDPGQRLCSRHRCKLTGRCTGLQPGGVSVSQGHRGPGTLGIEVGLRGLTCGPRCVRIPGKSSCNWVVGCVCWIQSRGSTPGTGANPKVSG